MDVISVDCAYDMCFFDSSLARFASTQSSCLFLVNLPLYYRFSITFKTLRERIQCIDSPSFLLLIKAPALFRPINCGATEVLAGVLLVDGVVYGLIATFHQDYIGGNGNVLRVTLPLMLSALRCLVLGCPDATGSIIETCKEIYLLGGLSCRGLPIAAAFSLPSEDLDLFDHFPSSFFGTKAVQLSCGRSSVIADWENCELYVPVPVSAHTSAVPDFSSLLPCNIQQEHFYMLKHEHTVSEEFNTHQLLSFLLSMYESKLYDGWKSVTDLSSRISDSGQLYFSGIWMQTINFSYPVLYKVQLCHHLSSSFEPELARDCFMAFLLVADSYVHEDDEDDMEYIGFQNFDKMTTFATYLSACVYFLVQDLNRIPEPHRKYLIFKTPVIWLFKWMAKVCQLVGGSKELSTCFLESNPGPLIPSK